MASQELYPRITDADVDRRRRIRRSTQAFIPQARDDEPGRAIMNMMIAQGALSETSFFIGFKSFANVVRFGDFNLCDGAINLSCANRCETNPNYANRLFRLGEQDLLLTLDIKMKIKLYKSFVRATGLSGLELGQLISPATGGVNHLDPQQERLTQIFIYHHLSHPGMIAPVPAGYTKRISLELASTAALTDCSPWLLSAIMPDTQEWREKFINEVVDAHSAGRPYRNPYTGVVFHHWTPQGIKNPFFGADKLPNFSKHMAETEHLRIVWQGINEPRQPLRVVFDMVDSQPRGGDFLLEYLPVNATESGRLRLAVERKRGNTQCYLKGNGRLVLRIRREEDLPDNDKLRSWYFHHRRQWHFMFYTMEETKKGAFDGFLIPQAAFPDEFYRSTELWLEAPAGWETKYRVRVSPRRMDHGEAIERILDDAFLSQFRIMGRPQREERFCMDPFVELDPEEEDEDEVLGDEEEEEQTQAEPTFDTETMATPSKLDPKHPEYRYYWYTTKGSTILRALNTVCAEENSGIILPLEYGRSLFLDCTWDDTDVRCFEDTGEPPRKLLSMRFSKPCVMLCLEDVFFNRPGLVKTGHTSQIATSVRNTAWRANCETKDPRLYIRAAGNLHDYLTSPRTLLVIPNEQMLQVPDTIRTEASVNPFSNPATDKLLRPPLDEHNFTFDARDTVAKLRQLLAGEDWQINPTAGNGLQEPVIFRAERYTSTIREALELMAEDVYSWGTKFFDPNANYAQILAERRAGKS